MKSVLISIQPKWCELIASGKKTVEVRKTRPKIEMPFKCYIYATKSGDRLVLKNDKVFEISRAITGKVIGEFVCDEIYDCRDVNMDDTCITVEEWLHYTRGHKGVVYGWHISNLIIYDKPRELSEFWNYCERCDKRPIACKFAYEVSNESGYYFECMCDFKRPIERPPQSWCYVEGSEGK